VRQEACRRPDRYFSGVHIRVVAKDVYDAVAENLAPRYLKLERLKPAEL
jgi:hypothetical protein